MVKPGDTIQDIDGLMGEKGETYLIRSYNAVRDVYVLTNPRNREKYTVTKDLMKYLDKGPICETHGPKLYHSRKEKYFCPFCR